MDTYTDPIYRYNSLLAAVPRPAPNAQLSTPALQQVIDAPSSQADPVGSLAEHIALNSNLSKSQAMAVVKSTSPAAKPDASAVSDAAAAATAISGDVELSDPVMLWPWARCTFAALLVIALGGSGWLAYQLANDSSGNSVSAWAYAALTVTAVVSFVGALVLIMGYKNVTIKGSGGPSSS